MYYLKKLHSISFLTDHYLDVSPHLLVLLLAPLVELHSQLSPAGPRLPVAAEGVAVAEDDAAAHELVQHQVRIPHLDLDSFCRSVPE